MNAAQVISWGYEQIRESEEGVPDFDEAIRLCSENDGEPGPTEVELVELKATWDEEFHDVVKLVIPEVLQGVTFDDTIDVSEDLDTIVRNLEEFVEQKEFEAEVTLAWGNHETSLTEVQTGTQKINGLRKQKMGTQIKSARCETCKDEYPAEYLELVKKCNSCGMPFVMNDIVGSFEECPACHSKNIVVATEHGCPICYTECEIRTLTWDEIGCTWLTLLEWEALYYWDEVEPAPVVEAITEPGFTEPTPEVETPQYGKGGIDYSAWVGREVGVSQKSWAGCKGEVVEMTDTWTKIRMTQAPKDLKSQVGKEYRTRTKNVFPINGQNWVGATK